MARIDLEKTIAQVEFSPEIWEWLDLVGEMVSITQKEALEQERSFVAVSPYHNLLRWFINREIGSLNAIYLLLRMELVYQAAAHIRLLCENVITLRYILLDPEERTRAFLDYSAIDAYKIGETYLHWESQTAKPQHIKKMKSQQEEFKKRFEKVHDRYTYVTRKKKKTKEFINWCNLPLKEQADKCGIEMQKLYAIGYRQLSAYVHGSAWALRRQEAYISKNYDQTVVMIDYANLTRMLLAVWIEWLKIMSQELGWEALGNAHSIVERCNELDEATLQRVTKLRKQGRETATKSESKAADPESHCVLCDGPAGEGSRSFSITPEASALLKFGRPDADPETVLSKNVICAKCQALSQEERQKLAMKAIDRELKSYRDFIRDQI
jgi:hypothetical protein